MRPREQSQPGRRMQQEAPTSSSCQWRSFGTATSFEGAMVFRHFEQQQREFEEDFRKRLCHSRDCRKVFREARLQQFQVLIAAFTLMSFCGLVVAFWREEMGKLFMTIFAILFGAIIVLAMLVIVVFIPRRCDRRLKQLDEQYEWPHGTTTQDQ